MSTLDVETLARLANQILNEGLGPAVGAGSSPTSSPPPSAAPLGPHGIDAQSPGRSTPGTAAPLAAGEQVTTPPAAAPAVATPTPAAPPPEPAATSSWLDDLGATAAQPYYFLAAATTSTERVATAPTPAAPDAASGRAGHDVHGVRHEFPILQQRINGRPLIWFDNAATTQKPRAVVDRLSRFYEQENSNVHRAAHTLAARSTDAYEGARASVARFIGASSPDEIVWTRGTTEAINLVANSWGRANIGAGDEIILTHLEHHANIVPWKLLADDVGAHLRVVPVDDAGQVRLDALAGLLSARTKLIAVAHVSNALGTIVPVEAFVAAARSVGARILVDGAQSVAHLKADVLALDVDFFVFSGHKIFAPTGIGALYAKAEVLDSMPPWQGGGNMIRDVAFETITYNDPPTRFEAGTGSIGDAVGLGAALDWLDGVGVPAVAAYEHHLLEYATAAMEAVHGLRIIGTAPSKASVLSFVLDGWDPVDVGRALDQEGIAVRAGHHCAQPILRRLGYETTVRASLALYNTSDEVDRFTSALHRLSRRR